MPPKGPPKGDQSLSDKDQVFLVECIKSSKERLMPDYDTVARATGMSVGGAANKYRAIMKRFEEGGNGEADSKPAKKRAKAAPTKKNPPVIEIGDEDREEGRDGGEFDEPPKKKPATTKTKAPAPKADRKKGIAKKEAPIKSDEKVEENADSDEGENGEDQDDNADMKDEEDLA